MSLYQLAQRRASAGRLIKVGLIGAGKFGSMFLNQAPSMAGIEIAVIADLDPDRAWNACRSVGGDAARIARTRFLASGMEACADPDIDVVVEATGSPPAGEIVRWADVAVPDSEAVRVRCEMEQRFAPVPAAMAAK